MAEEHFQGQANMSDVMGDRAPRTRRVILAVGVLAALVICIAALSAAFSLRESTRREWSEQMSSLSLILAEQVTQTLFSAHTVLDSFDDVVKQAKLEDEPSFRAFVSDEARYRLLVDKTDANPIIDVATFVAKDGQVLNFTRSFPPAKINLSDRDYFLAHSADPTIDTYTSVPVRNKGNGKWVFYISKRVNNSQGEMLGLILVGVSVETFSRFYESVGTKLGEGASLSLYRSDFTLMTRWPFVDDLVGKKNLASVAHKVVAEAKRDNDVVISTSARATDANRVQTRMVAPRVVKRYPFIVVPVITEQLYLRHWRTSINWIFGGAAFSLLLVLLGMRWLLRAYGLLQQELAERVRAQASLRTAHEELENRVRERTGQLTAEIAERRLAQEALAQVNSQIASVSHRAGMAEVANSVLHNVGNVLNSVNVSVSLLSERLKRTPLADFPQATALMRTHEGDLADYLTQDEQGRQLPVFLGMLSQQWEVEQNAMLTETELLRNSVQHIKEIVSRQQSLSGHSAVTETFIVKEAINDALTIHGSALERSGIKVDVSAQGSMLWRGDRSKIAQIILNLVVNAEEALAASRTEDRVLTIDSVHGDDGSLVVTVTDNGVGITAATLEKLFSYGFTTKSDGHGFGLHASALAAQEMGGSLKAYSDGENRGAAFVLSLPSAS
jgi:signal transduction histidine kinase